MYFIFKLVDFSASHLYLRRISNIFRRKCRYHMSFCSTQRKCYILVQQKTITKASDVQNECIGGNHNILTRCKKQSQLKTQFFDQVIDIDQMIAKIDILYNCVNHTTHKYMNVFDIRGVSQK